MPEPAPASEPRCADPVSLDYPSLHWHHAQGWTPGPEPLAVETPLAIEVAFARHGQPVTRQLTLTMRTPGDDEDLALGFLFHEGLIPDLTAVRAITAVDRGGRADTIASVRVELAQPPRDDLERASRAGLVSSACGLCGRAALDDLPMGQDRLPDDFAPMACEIVAHLPERLRHQQRCFAQTGGTHGAGLFDDQGNLLLVREDVGRHNAVDKLTGAALRARMPLAGRVLVLSGRVAFELVQKAAAAGVAMVVAVGAPSSLAVDLAHAAGLTLVGFARERRFNVYTHAHRVQPGAGGRAAARPASPV